MRVYLLLAIAHLFVSSTVISSIEANQKLCNAPSKTILNGKRSSLATEQFKIGSTVRYWCQSGYYIRGSRYLKCILRNGKAQWIGRPPICVGEFQNSNSTFQFSDSTKYALLFSILCNNKNYTIIIIIIIKINTN